jgi:hypothetical protein
MPSLQEFSGDQSHRKDITELWFNMAIESLWGKILTQRLIGET